MKVFHYNESRPFREEPDLHLMYWGKQVCPPRHSFGPGVRDHYKVHMVHSGEGTVRVAGHTYKVYPGQAFLLYPDTVIQYEADATNPWTYSWIAFRGEQAASILGRSALGKERPVFSMDLERMPRLYEDLNEIAPDSPVRDLRLQSALLGVLSAMVEAAPAAGVGGSRRSRQEEYVHRSLEFLHTHYGESITVQQLADLLGLERKYFTALFKQSVGTPPRQYLLEYRMDCACSLLRQGMYTVGEVARSVGYPDVPLFSKMFKRCKGVPPTAYLPRRTNQTR